MGVGLVLLEEAQGLVSLQTGQAWCPQSPAYTFLPGLTEDPGIWNLSAGDHPFRILTSLLSCESVTSS